MTQEERWQKRDDEVINFIEKEHRKPSKYYPKEKLMFPSYTITRNYIMLAV